ncbi:MAG: NAD(P)/FAD-dependent oxidoreductase, partial [Acidobacteria bacterium]|nr:NAD(P)/FAD-dependent oxidoreductase [Acidobacteriota bacterium]
MEERNRTSQAPMNRRELLRISGTAVVGLAGTESDPLFAAQRKRTGKRVIVIGAGITGLCCAYELVKRGNDVTVLEASKRVGGHVRTLSDPFADGLYAEVGAEHFNQPEYIQYWRYVKEFKLTAIPHPVRQNRIRFLNGERFTEEDLRRIGVLQKLGLNHRESEFLKEHAWPELPQLYFERYVDNIRDETDPFRGNPGKLDQIS